MASLHRLKTLAQLTRGHAATLWNTPFEFWRGYSYGRKFAVGSSHPTSELSPECWLEDYFDNLTVGPGLWKWRHYFPIYERHLSKFRGKEVHILEIGIFSGGSLDMWHAYFGDKSYVYGVDIEPACRTYENANTRIFIGDQADGDFWQKVIREIPRLDIVVDDGGHRSFQQIATLEALLPHLRPGGVYLCEDVHDSFNSFHGYVEGLSRNLNTMRPTGENLVVNATEFQRSIDSIHLYPFITVIERRTGQLDQMSAPKHGAEWQPFLGVQLPDRTD